MASRTEFLCRNNTSCRRTSTRWIRWPRHTWSLLWRNPGKTAKNTFYTDAPKQQPSARATCPKTASSILKPNEINAPQSRNSALHRNIGADKLRRDNLRSILSVADLYQFFFGVIVDVFKVWDREVLAISFRMDWVGRTFRSKVIDLFILGQVSWTKKEKKHEQVSTLLPNTGTRVAYRH